MRHSLSDENACLRTLLDTQQQHTVRKMAEFKRQLSAGDGLRQRNQPAEGVGR